MEKEEEKKCRQERKKESLNPLYSQRIWKKASQGLSKDYPEKDQAQEQNKTKHIIQRKGF